MPNDHTGPDHEPTSPASPPDTPDAERQRRLDAVNFGRDIVEMEGFTLSEEAEAFGRQFVEGVLTLSEYITSILGISKDDTDPDKWNERQIIAMRMTELYFIPL